jgi:hypothetical protein
MENETGTTLKHQGDNFEHHDGYGQQNLSVVLAMVMMLAFVVEQRQQRCCAFLQAVSAKMGRKRLWWKRISALCYDDAMEFMRQRLAARFFSATPVHGIVTRRGGLVLT